MRYLVVFYSRTGTTKRVAEKLSSLLHSDIEEIIDLTKRTGFIGWLKSGRDGSGKRLTTIKETEKDPGSYDIVIIGTPVWGFNMSAPVRTYLTLNKERFKNTAFFLTSDGSRVNEAVFVDMVEVSTRKPLATLALRKNNVLKNQYYPELEILVQETIARIPSALS
jgi:flavodoxin